MSFLHPLWLCALAVPVALLARIVRGAGHRVVLPFDHALPAEPRGLRSLLESAGALPALLLAVAVVLCAGPQRLGEPKERRKLTNIQLCLDISGSMSATFGEETRYDAAMASVERFLDYRSGDAVGLTFFGSSVLHWCPLTSDVSAIRCAPPFMRPEHVPPWFGGTEIAKALRACKEVLTERQEGDRMIVLITDGESYDLGNGGAEEVARELAQQDIAVFAIIIGGEAIQDEIVQVTQATHGEAFTADDPEALQAVFRRIDAMKKAELEKTIGDTLDDSAPWARAGLVLLACALVASLGVRYTPW